MPYATDEWWESYRLYLLEAMPRHRRAAGRLLSQFPVRVVDLGCGKFCSADAIFVPDWYTGLDTNPPGRPDTIELDYRDTPQVLSILNEFEVDTITSLFSAEITAPAEENYLMYEDFFARAPSVQQILVSGFYYADGREEEPYVSEVGGLKSYQSNTPIEAYPSKLFDETRLTIRGPSKLFGPDVIEVFKLLERKKS